MEVETPPVTNNNIDLLGISLNPSATNNGEGGGGDKHEGDNQKMETEEEKVDKKEEVIEQPMKIDGSEETNNNHVQKPQKMVLGMTSLHPLSSLPLPRPRVSSSSLPGKCWNSVSLNENSGVHSSRKDNHW